MTKTDLSPIRDLLESSHCADPWSAIAEGAFVSKVDVPPKPTAPPCSISVSSSDAQIAAARSAWADYNVQLDAYKAARKARSEDQSLQELRFKLFLFHYYDVVDNPKADEAYSIAWSHTHSTGLSDVASFFGDLVHLIK